MNLVLKLAWAVLKPVVMAQAEQLAEDVTEPLFAQLQRPSSRAHPSTGVWLACGAAVAVVAAVVVGVAVAAPGHVGTPVDGD